MAKAEGRLNARGPRDPAESAAVEAELTRLKAEMATLSRESGDLSLGAMIGLFLRGGVNAKTRQSYRRQAQIQAELAALRFRRGVSWAVTDLSLGQMRATAIARECVAKVAMYDAGWAQSLGHPVIKDEAVTWTDSTARLWMKDYLLPVLPPQVAEHMCAATIQSAKLGGTVSSDELVYLPSHQDLSKLSRGWGVLDGEQIGFWLRDVGHGVGRNGQRALDGDDSYNPMGYSYGIQPLITLDLATFPSIMEAGDGRPSERTA